MLATPVITGNAPASGPRPINLNKDRRQVINLLNLTFGHRDQRTFGEQISLSYPSQVSLHWNPLSRGHSPGFVWEEAGDILGNVTLLETEISGRFIIANVAVHPDYQRRGIARTLMRESLDYIRQVKGQLVLLQVERENQAAISLYQSLGFEIIGSMNHWYVTPARLKFETLKPAADISMRKLGKADWKSLYELDRQVVDPDLNWPTPPSPDLFKTGYWRRFVDFLNGQKLEGWLVEKHSNSLGKNEIVGMITIFSNWGRPSQLRIRIDPQWQGELENALLHRSLRPIKKQGVGSIVITHPADDEYVGKLLSAANFQLRRELTIMKKMESKAHQLSV